MPAPCRLPVLIALLSALPAAGAAPTSADAQHSESASLDVEIAALRSTKGVIRICLTSDRRYFPDCANDPASHHVTVPANGERHVRFVNLPRAHYALSLIHDENGNGKLDTRLGIPREGFGFSRNPRILFGPPSFKATSFPLDSGLVRMQVKMEYML